MKETCPLIIPTDLLYKNGQYYALKILKPAGLLQGFTVCKKLGWVRGQELLILILIVHEMITGGYVVKKGLDYPYVICECSLTEILR